MSNFDHPNVLPVLGVCLNNNPFYLILELMEAGDLLAFLRGARQENVSNSDILSLVSNCYILIGSSITDTS